MLKKAFTLIELLVVIAIIGTLIAVVTVNFTTAQKQARDSRRREDISAIQTALEQYYAINGTYPLPAAIGTAFDAGSAPSDPKNVAPYEYTFNSTVDGYCVCAFFETQKGNAQAPTLGVPVCNFDSSGTAEYLCVQNQQ